MYSVDCCPKGLVIGKQGENEAEKIAIDFSPWASEFGAGTISARLRRPKDSAAYPVALITEGTTATWTISATDTQYAGAGSLQLVYIVGDVVAKSVIWPVRVLPSLEAGEAPEPYESWLDTLEGLAADTQGNARDAAASAADAAQSATSAAASAQDAAESAASITGLTAVAETLPEGSEASASFDGATDTLTLGIPKGDTGAAGPKGDTGSAGADGFSPSASVTKQDGNIVITVTDKDGTTSETLEVDNAIDEDSVNPVQNAAIVEAMRSMLPVDTASGSIASFPDGADDVPMLSLKAHIEPVQDLHGYDSPWPAGGGANILDPNLRFTAGTYFGGAVIATADGYNITLSGTPTESGNITTNNIPTADAIVMPAGTYTSVGAIFSTYKADGSWYTNRQVGTWTADEPFIVKQAYIQAVAGTPLSGSRFIAIAKGSTAPTSWTPYSNVCPITGHTGVNISHSGADITNPDVIPVSWETEAGTVYGGTLDVVSGKLTVDRAMVDMGTLTWKTGWSGFYEDAIRVPVLANVIPNIICSLYETRKFVETTDPRISIIYGGEGYASNGNIFIKDSRYSDASAFKAAMSGVQLVYELATPIEYTLTPQEVRTFLGQNNIWSDTGDMSVTYRADIAKYIEKKVNG